MSINKENIEEYIFDYLEGNLTNEQVSEFREYINSDSEAKTELEYWKSSYVVDNLRVDSSEFSSLKKSNKLYYWASAAGLAFLLGVGSTYYALNNGSDIPVSSEEITEQEVIQESNLKNQTSTEIEVVEQKLNKENTLPQKIDRDERSYTTSPEVELNKKVSIETEDMNITDVREIDLNSSESNREVVSDKVEINKNVQEEEESKKKKKAVDVIELNSEGF